MSPSSVPCRRFVTILLFWAAAVRAEVRLNEVLYDPAGADGGEEFVELHNSGAATVSLTGWRLQFANGAVGDVWATRWTGRVGDEIRPGGRYLIVDQGWSGVPADAVASLGLQNGPDALRLLDGEAVVDRLGWGALETPALYEGAPHPGAAGGAALARRPDGRDTDDNAADWQVLDTPTPGAPNYPSFGLAIAAFDAEPPSLAAPGWPVRLELTCVNAGVDTLPPARLVLADDTGGALATTETGALPPAARSVVGFEWTPARDARVDLRLYWPLSPADTLVAAAGPYRCGPAPLILTEVMAAPETGACEWVEIAAAAETAVDLAGYALCDEGGAPSALPARILDAGERLLLVQDAEVYAAWWFERRREGAPRSCPDVEPRFNAVELDGPWPTLNNTPPEGRAFADRIRLIEPGGGVDDHAVIGGAGAAVSVDRSLERGGLRPAGHPLGLWGPCTATAGSTPGCLNSREVAATAAGALTATPVDPALGTGVYFDFDLHGNEVSWSLVVYDLTGYAVRDLGGDELGPGSRRVIWDGLDDDGRLPPPEPSLALLTVTDAAGARTRRHKILVVTDAAAGR